MLHQVPVLPVPPAEVERNPLAMAEFESVTGQIRNSFQHVALLDRVHNMKVPPAAGDHCTLAASCGQCLVNRAEATPPHHKSSF